MQKFPPMDIWHTKLWGGCITISRTHTNTHKHPHTHHIRTLSRTHIYTHTRLSTGMPFIASLGASRLGKKVLLLFLLLWNCFPNEVDSMAGWFSRDIYWKLRGDLGSNISTKIFHKLNDLFRKQEISVINFHLGIFVYLLQKEALGTHPHDIITGMPI